MIERDHHLRLRKQCKLPTLNRSGLYYQHVGASSENLTILRKLEEHYHHTPFYGDPRLRYWLKAEGYRINKND